MPTLLPGAMPRPAKRTRAMVLVLGLMLGVISGVMAPPILAQPTYQGRVQHDGAPPAQTHAQTHAQTLLTRLLAANGLSPTAVEGIQLLPDEDLNAATDGRRILFTQGLWRALRTDDQRAFVISHELAHITRHHVPKTQLRRFGLLAVDHWLQSRLSNGGESPRPLLNAATQTGLALTELSFSRQQEYGADELGMQYLIRAGFRPQAALETLAILDRASPARTPQFLRSHPLNQNRMRELVKRYQTVR